MVVVPEGVGLVEEVRKEVAASGWGTAQVLGASGGLRCLRFSGRNGSVPRSQGVESRCDDLTVEIHAQHCIVKRR